MALSVVRLRLSPMRVKPFSTSLDTFRASKAINTMYIRLIIFWRGETGRFFTEDMGLGSRGNF